MFIYREQVAVGSHLPGTVTLAKDQFTSRARNYTMPTTKDLSNVADTDNCLAF